MISIIPITPIPNRKFSCKILVDNQNLVLQFMLQYNELADYWLVDISDDKGNSLISCLPVIPAQNILEQFSYMNIGSAAIIPATTILEEWPSQSTLGVDWYLVWSDTVG